MARKCCPTCLGIASYLAREWVRDDSGVSIYKKASVRRTCKVCDGTGRIRESEKLHTHYCNTQAAQRQILPGFENPPKQVERTLGYLLVIALFSYAWFVLSKGRGEIDVWPKIAIALEASIVLLVVLRRFPATSRFLRWCTLAFFLMVVCGGFALEVVRL